MLIQYRNFIPWLMKGSLAILDQALFTGSNFVISIMLARWLTPEAYGTYAVAFAIFLLLLVFYQALILEPMLVFGGSLYRNCVRDYIRSLLVLHSALGLVMLIVVFLAAGVALRLDRSGSLPGALAGVGIATPLVLLFWLAKRIFYVMLSPAASVCGALLYSILLIGGLAVLYRRGSLSPFSALVLMGIAGLGSGVFLFTYLGFRLPASEYVLEIAEIWRRHWRYGRWALAANAMMWVPVSIYYPLLSAFSGMTQAGELKALMNFFSPVLQTCAALASLMLPYGTRVLREKGLGLANSVSQRMTFLCLSCAIPYWLAVLLFKGPVFRVVYSGRYTEVAYLLPIVALTSLFGGAFFGPSTALRAMESPRSVFIAVTASSSISVAIGILATWALGLRGALWSMALSETLAFAAAFLLVRRKTDEFSKAVQSIPVLSSVD